MQNKKEHIELTLPRVYSLHGVPHGVETKQ